MLPDLGQEVLQVFIELLLVRLGRFHQVVNNRAGLNTVDDATDVPIGTSNGEQADRPFCSSNYR